jgi:hypothetical protein
MATIRAATEERVFTATTWLGLNQAGDGDTNLKMGEASHMVNFRVTPDGALKKRPGMKTILAISNREFKNIWHGFVNDEEITVVSSDYGLHVFENGMDGAATTYAFGANVTAFIGFKNKLYMLCDDDVYRVFDGQTVSEVVGYVPVIVEACKPAGGGTELQGINKLSKKRRVWFSPDGTSTEYVLPEDDLSSIDSAVNRVTGASLTYTANVSAGKLVFSTAPPEGENTLEVTYTAKTDDKSAVCKMRYAELYNGTTDNRVFIYGDGTNRALYSGLDYPGGNPRADYFPDLNIIDIGENKPITQMIRHYSRLLTFTTGSAYSVQYGMISTADNRTIPAFYWTPVNRSIGNIAPNMVQLVDNDPLTLFQHSIYRWANNGSYSSNLTIDERQARRISDKVWRSLDGFDLENAYCFDNNESKEWYCINPDGRALVYAYGLGDVWYYYEDFPIVRMATIDGELYGIRKTDKSEIVHISDIYRNDCGEAINARWESGNMHFNADYRRKYSAMLWLGLVPLYNTELMVTVQTDRKTDFAKKVITQNMATFNHANFARWSFKVQRTPRVQRLKLKAKKFTYYKLILVNDSDASTAEVSSADIRVRYTGYVR